MIIFWNLNKNKKRLNINSKFKKNKVFNRVRLLKRMIMEINLVSNRSKNFSNSFNILSKKRKNWKNWTRNLMIKMMFNFYQVKKSRIQFKNLLNKMNKFFLKFLRNIWIKAKLKIKKFLSLKILTMLDPPLTTPAGRRPSRPRRLRWRGWDPRRQPRQSRRSSGRQRESHELVHRPGHEG